jgi:hypothetical protein
MALRLTPMGRGERFEVRGERREAKVKVKAEAKADEK